MIDHPFPTWLAPLAAAGGFVALWLGVSFGISGMGWRAFAMRYPSTSVPSGPFYTAWSARFSSILASYRNVVRVAFLPEGIHFSVFFPFRAGHDPFMLPWSSVKRAEHRQGLIGGRYEIEIDDPAGHISLWLAPAVEADISRHLQSRPPQAHTAPAS